MFTPPARRALHELPAYLAGTLPARRRQVLEARLAADPALQGERDRLAALAACLVAHDPAHPPDPAAAAALKQRLHAELDRTLVRSARPAWRAVLMACSAAAVLFCAGAVAGAKLFPQEVVREVVVERRVAVAVPVPVAQPVTIERVVEKRVEVPVERVVTRWRTRTVTRTVVRDQGVPQPPASRVAEAPSRPSQPVVPVVEIPADASRPGGAGVSMVAVSTRPGVVDF